MRRLIGIPTLWLSLTAASLLAQDATRSDGTAIVRTGDTEYLIPIVCDDPAAAARGFATEPSRITRDRTGRSTPVNLRLRQWPDSSELVVTFERYTAWIPTPATAGPTLMLSIAMSPISVVRDGIPVTMTYDRWQSGDRPEGIDIVVEVDCRNRDPAAPASRRL